jgi:hypothetical protein
MAETIDTALPKDTWTSVTTTLTDGSSYSMQNTSSDIVRVYESATVPTGTHIGFILNPSKFTQIKPATGFEIYCRPERDYGNVAISLAV